MSSADNLCVARAELLSAAREKARQFRSSESWEFRSLSDLRAGGLFSLIQQWNAFPSAFFYTPDVSTTRLLLTWLLLTRWLGQKSWAIDRDSKLFPITLAWIAKEITSSLIQSLLAPLFVFKIRGRVNSAELEMKNAERRPRGSIKRVLYLRTDLWFGDFEGGATTHTKGMISGFQKCGCEVKLAAPDSSVLTSFTIPNEGFFRRKEELSEMAYNAVLEKKLPALIDAFKPDLIYQRLSLFNYAGVLAARRAGLPIVLEHNGSFSWIHRNWGRALRNEGLSDHVEKVCLDQADRIVTVSAALSNELKRNGVPSSKILQMTNGVDLDSFGNKADGQSIRKQLGLEDSIVVGFIGTFSQWHGVEVLARAVQRVVSQNKNVRFVFIGDGPLKPNVVKILNEAGVASSVTLTGSISHQMIPSYLAACDILTSPHVPNPDGTEFFGSPTKLFEYMASGRPIVASRLGQIEDVLKKGEIAILVEPNNIEELAQAILRLAADPPARLKWGQLAKAESSRYSWEANARRVLEEVK